MDTAQNVLIVGGTGMLGREIVSLLHAQGYHTRVMTRKPEIINHVFPDGAEIVSGDLIDVKSLVRLTEGMDTVIASAHALLGKGKYSSEKVDLAGHKNLIDIAKKAGVKKFIYISVLGAGPDAPVDFWRTKYAVEEYIKQSGLHYAIIRSAAFMEMHLHELIGKSVLKKGKVTILGNGINPTNFISVQDVASLVLQVLQSPEQDQLIEIGGPDNMTKNDVATMYGRFSGKEVKISHLKPAMLHILASVLKPFHPGISRIMKLSAAFDNTDQTFDPRPTLEKYPLQLTSVADFIKKNVEIVADNT